MVKLLSSSVEFNVNNLEGSKPKRNDNRYYVFLKHVDEYNPTEKVIYQTPKLKMSSSLTTNVKDDEDSNVDVQELKSFVEVKTTNADFINKLKEIDDEILKYVKDKKGEWFPGKEITDSFLEVGQIGSIRENKSNKKEHIFQLKTSKDIQIFDMNKKKLENSELKEHDEVSFIIQLVGIWFTATRWGLSWKIQQVRKHKTKEPLKGYLFCEDDTDEQHSDDDLIVPPGM